MAMEFAASVTSGAMAGYGTKQLTDKLETGDTEIDILRDIHMSLMAIHALLLDIDRRDLPDIFKIINLGKDGKAPAYTLNLEGLTYCRIFVGSSTVLSIQSLLGVFKITLTPGIWQVFDLPDNSVLSLDTSNTSDTASVYFRFTNDKP